MTTSAHLIAHHTIHADGIFRGGDTSFSACYSDTLIKRPQKQHITLCSAETLHVYVVRGASRCLSSLLNKHRAPIASLGRLQIHVMAVLSLANYHQEKLHKETFNSVTTVW
jgi:hypothetical protein